MKSSIHFLSSLTFASILCLQINSDADGDYFNGHVWRLPVKAPQIESIGFKDAKTLWLLDEITAAVYEAPLKKLVKIK